MLTVLVCTMAIVAAAAGDGANSASAAPIVMRIRLPGNLGVETSGNLLVATRYVEGELRYWDWNALKTEPRTTPSLWPDDTTVLGDGMIAEDVRLGLPHEMLERAKIREKDRAKQKGEKDDGGRWKTTEKDKAMMREFEEKEQKRNQEWADKEDRIVAQMKYLQQMKKTGGKGFVMRSASGKEFSMIDCGNDKDWYISGLTHSQDGRILGVWQCQTIITKDSSTWGIRAGIVDRKANSVHWVASTTGDERKNNDGPHTTGLRTRISDDGKRFLFFGGSGKGGWICLMDIEKQVVLWEHRGVAGTMDFSSGGFSPDGKKVYVGDRLGWVFCFDGDTGNQLPIGKSSIRGSYVAVSPDGQLLAVASGGGTRGLLIYETKSGTVLQYADPHGSFYSITFSPDNKFLAIACESGILIYDLAATTSSRHAAGRSETVSTPQALTTTRPSSHQELKSPATLSGHMGWVCSVVYSPDGKTLASGSTDNTIKFWNVATGNNTATLKGHSGAVKCVAFSRDGKTLASASEDKTIKLWDTAGGKSVATFNGHTDAVWSVAFSPDDKTLASGSDDTTIKLWDVASGKNTATLKGHSGHVMSVAYSPDGKTLASGCWDGEIKLWDVATGKNTAGLFRGHEPIMVVWITLTGDLASGGAGYGRWLAPDAGRTARATSLPVSA